MKIGKKSIGTMLALLLVGWLRHLFAENLAAVEFGKKAYSVTWNS